MMRQKLSLWAIGPDAVHTALKIMSGNFGKPDDMLASSGAKSSMQGRGNDKIAVVPIHGILTNDGPAYYGSRYPGIADAVEKAVSDPDVKRIILSVDSPGGEVVGLPETAAVIARAARVKPVSAIVEGAAASAAYWLTSQANDITLTPSGEVGSVGVRMMHVDMSKMLDDAGYKITELSAGDYKTEWSPYKALSDAAKDDMQARLQTSHKDFVAGVAAGRGRRASAAITKSKFGGGRMLSANDALFHGLIDRIQSPRAFIRAAISGPVPSAPKLGANTDIGLSAIRARLDLELLRA